MNGSLFRCITIISKEIKLIIIIKLNLLDTEGDFDPGMDILDYHDTEKSKTCLKFLITSFLVSKFLS